jgi:hypothetical protein
VITAVPLPVFSALLIGGFSFAGDNWTVKIFRVLAEGDVELLPQPATPTARKLTAIARRFIGLLLVPQQEQRQGERQHDRQPYRARVEFSHVASNPAAQVVSLPAPPEGGTSALVTQTACLAGAAGAVLF